MSGNFYLNQAQNALRDAYDNDTVYAFKVQFPSGKGFKFLAEVRQHTWSSGTITAVVAGNVFTSPVRVNWCPMWYRWRL